MKEAGCDSVPALIALSFTGGKQTNLSFVKSFAHDQWTIATENSATEVCRNENVRQRNKLTSYWKISGNSNFCYLNVLFVCPFRKVISLNPLSTVLLLACLRVHITKWMPPSESYFGRIWGEILWFLLWQFVFIFIIWRIRLFVRPTTAVHSETTNLHRLPSMGLQRQLPTI